MTHSDILVIGDGPAGCAAAIVAADAGCDVVMLGRGFSHGAPECVSTRALSLLEPLAPALYARSDAWLDTGLEHVSGRAVVRRELDDGLRAAASARGVMHPKRSFGALVPCVEGARVVGATSETQAYAARIVIDASGVNGCLRRGLPLEESVDSCAVWLRRGFAIGQAPQDVAHWQIAQDGWLWIRSASTRLIWTSLSARKEVDMAARAGLASSGMAWQQCRRWRRLRQAAGAGYFVCGDAAGYLDPASGDGLRFALESGIRAGTLAAEVTKHPGRASLAAALYADWAEQDYRATRAVLQDVYARAHLDIWCH